MKLSSGLGLTGLGIFGATFAFATLGGTSLTACSSSSSGGSSSGGSSGDTCTSAGVSCTVQPTNPGTGTPTSASHNYAIHKLYLGDTDRTGVANTSAWASYGYNLDNLVTTKSSTDVCTLAPGAGSATQIDGNGGIDNSFGENILPIVVEAAGTSTSQKINTSLQNGTFTIMTYVTGFDDSAGNTTSATGLTGVLLAGGNYPDAHDGGAPTWDTSTNWPISPALLTGCSATTGCTGCTFGSTSCATNPLTAAQITFPSAYQSGGTFVNGSPSEIDLALSIGGEALAIDVHAALITFEPQGPGSVTNGTIAGTLITSELISSLMSVAGNISTSLCTGSAFASIAQQIEQASDIVIDPTSGAVSNTKGVSCNGISIGLGFDSTEIAAPTAADIEAVSAGASNPCATDAGTD